LGARESNAGDDFHFWWAASRALGLIEPDAELQLLTIEGLSQVDDPDDEYEAVDVAEYFSGDTFDTSSAVVLSQLKYSTRQPDKPWTASRICEPRTRHAPSGSALSRRSVIADLAGVYSRLAAGRARQDLLTKLRISLVSNQPRDSLLEESVARAAESILLSGDVTRAALLKDLAEPYAQVIGKLAKAIGNRLKSSEFCDFLAVLDLSRTGSLDRATLVRSVRAGAAELTAGRGSDSAVRIFELVRGEALPESSRRGIRAADVLAQFGIADRGDLYPAPTQFPPVPDPLPAPGGRAVAEAVLAHPGGVVVAHGGAGVGKTTALQQMSAHLPPGSVVALFDCYGGGAYLNSGEERHTAHRFVLQIVNDLAQSCGTPLLLEPPTMEEDLWRRLARALSRASDALDPDAVLVLAVDAADNAAFAANRRGQRGFVPGVIELLLPPRVTVVLTARSHRVASLRADGASEVELLPFDTATSTAHMRRFRPEASDDDVAEFHSRTAGNPRVQFYVLTTSAAERWDMLHLLEKCVETPEPLFAEIVASALQVSGADAGGQRWLALMLALSRPISIGSFAAALDVDTASVVAFAKGLDPGVKLGGERIQFRDENFETFVRDSVDPPDVITAHARLAEMFRLRRTEDADAAAHVADHLFSAGRKVDLLRLALDEEVPPVVPDGFRRAEVQGRRLDLAARAAADVGTASDAVRLAVRGGEIASRVNALSSLIESHLDLVARYADMDLLREHALHDNRERWLAPMLMRLAAVLARDPTRHVAAREALDGAEAWLRRWTTSPKEETWGWEVDVDDVASAGEAQFRLDGAAAAVAWMRRWRPAGFALDASAALAARIARELGPSVLHDALHTYHVPPLAQAPFLAYAADPVAPDRDWVDEVVAAAIAAEPGETKPWHYLLIRAAARHGEPSAAAALALRLTPGLPSHRWGFATVDADGVTALRSLSIAAVLQGAELTVDDLVPPSLRPTNGAKSDDSRAYERRQWTETIAPLLGVALLAARAATNRADATELAVFVAEGLSHRLGAAAHRWFKFDDSYRAWAAIAVDAAIDSRAAPDLINELAVAAPALVPGEAPALWLDLAWALARQHEHADIVADLCLRAAETASREEYAAPERLDLLARAAEIAEHVVPALGQQLFDKAVDAASGVNDDAARLLAVYADLAGRAAVSEPERHALAAQLVAVAEAVAPFVTESGVIPYAAMASAAGHLDASVGLAAATRWDDEDKVGLSATLPAALLGAVDGGGIPAVQAIHLDHLVEGDRARLRFQLDVIERIPLSGSSLATTRLALVRAANWLRRDVSAQDQPALARQLLDWAAARGLDGPIWAVLEPVARFRLEDVDTGLRWRGDDRAAHVQNLLNNPERRNWHSLADDVAILAEAFVYGDEMRAYLRTVVGTAPAADRVEALGALAALPARLSSDASVVLPVLSECVASWRTWPGVAQWARAELPKFVERHLHDLALRQDVEVELDQLRAFDDDDAIRRAVLLALPDTRPNLTSFGWQNVAALLGRLCDPSEAAEALTALLRRRFAVGSPPPVGLAPIADASPVASLLWSGFGHPRRDVRWRVAHSARELLLQPDPSVSRTLAAALVECLDRSDAGAFRDPTLHFYKMSADASLLVALQRIAAERPAALTAHLANLTRRATRRDFPHAQIRELARQTALALTTPNGGVDDELHLANQPVACSIDRTFQHRRDDRVVSAERRYDFDPMDTLPYWYGPLAHVFDLPVDDVADRAERWILDEWGLSEDDWMRDARELRDQRSYERMSHRHGSIPPEENLRLYLEYHAMMVAAGELIDAGTTIHVDSYDDAEDPWWAWLRRHLPESENTWLADLRNPVPIEPDLLGELPPLEEWFTPSDHAYDNALHLVDGQLPDAVLVAGRTSLSRRGGYSLTFIRSALVAPKHATALQRALAAAPNPTDWKLPDEDEIDFEIHHGEFVLRGWLTEGRDERAGVDEHDPYAHGMSMSLPMPGQLFRNATAATPERAGLVLRGPDSTVVAQAVQWADREGGDDASVTSSGNRVYVARGPLLKYLAETQMTLILEVQIGRHRSSGGFGDYQPPRSRIYLIDSAGGITVR
jgi:hypothetical protein